MNKLLECIDDKDVVGVTYGNIYVVIEDKQLPCYTILNDKNIKFDYLKTRFKEIKGFNIIEALKMPVGTEFKVVYENGKINSNTVKVDNFEYADGNKLIWLDGEEIYLGSNFILATFILVQQKPVNFMDVATSNKLCKVEHEHITKILNENITLKEFDNDEVSYNWFLRYKNEGYLSLNLLMNTVMSFLNAREFKEVIKDGKWYLSDKEDIDLKH